MENGMMKMGRAAAISAGFALALAANAGARGAGDAGSAAFYDSSRLDTASPFGGSGYGGSGSMGGTGLEQDLGLPDTSFDLPVAPLGEPDNSLGMPEDNPGGYPFGETGAEDQVFHGGTGIGGSGPDTLPLLDSIDADSGIFDPYGQPGTGGTGDTGMGGTGNGGSGIPGGDSLDAPLDSTESLDSLGVPDWMEQG